MSLPRPLDDLPPPPPPRVQLITNPHAGWWRRRQADALRRAFEDAGACVIRSRSEGAVVIAPAVDHVCSVGGDGTLRHVVSAVALAHPRPSISVYPIGTVNLLARECGYVARPIAFVRRALAPRTPRLHFTARVNGTPMLTCASIGPDSQAVDRVSPLLKRLIGRWAYLAAFIGLLARWPRHQLTVVADGRVTRCEALYVAKGRYFAGSWSVAPAAALDAPLLQAVALPACGRRAFARFAWSIFRGRTAAEAIHFTCTSLSVTADAPVSVQADGDVVATLPVAIAVDALPLVFS